MSKREKVGAILTFLGHMAPCNKRASAPPDIALDAKPAGGVVRDEEVRRAGAEPAAFGLELDSGVWAAVPALAGGAFAGPTHRLCVVLCFGAPGLIGCSSTVCSCRSTVEK